MYVGYHGRPQLKKYEHPKGMTLVIKAQEVSFCAIDNVPPINAKDQAVLELVNPITLEDSLETTL